MKKKMKINIRWMLVLYDLVVFAVVDALLFFLYDPIPLAGIVFHTVLSLLSVFLCRFIGNIYRQIWRYGGIQCYIRLLWTDAAAFCIYYLSARILKVYEITFVRMLSFICINLLGTLAIRMIYRYAYQYGNKETGKGKFLNRLLTVFSGLSGDEKAENRIKVAIIGAGRTGVSLAEDLLNNSSSSYEPVCFVDISDRKAGREINGIPVLLESAAVYAKLEKIGVQEIIFAIPSVDADKKKQLYEQYRKTGCKLKIYDYPIMQTAGGKKHLREFDIEELLFRKPVQVLDEKTKNYYKNKIIMITGGGGSIGSELCRQLARMEPEQLIILDIYENGAYDVQQELKMAYGDTEDFRVEIASITNQRSMRRVFEKYHPQIVINAAAHKHVPLMENNCIEAIENNVFGTKTVVDLCEEYHVERFMMVSTDKAVNPTNVMGATKRMCEMIVQSAATAGTVKYSTTRFGNVLGSAGSVIPLFKKQIAGGGPVTITDRRIIRYFMTIPEASQLVLTSGSMAKNGELFVLDMGKPVRILDLAENMIRLSGRQDVRIVETGLRPGEKLYEELLVKTEKLDRTENDMIFIEKDTPLKPEHMEEILKELKEACLTENETVARDALRKAVPTFMKPEEVNGKVRNGE